VNVEELIDLAKLMFVNRERIVENSHLRKKKVVNTRDVGELQKKAPQPWR